MEIGSIRRSRGAHLIIYLGVVATAIMILFPPFSTLSGREFAFLLTGPEWLRGVDAVGADLGIAARIDWIALVGQLAVVWLVVAGGVWFVVGTADDLRIPAPAFIAAVLSIVLVMPAGAQVNQQETSQEASPDGVSQDRVSPDVPVSMQGGRYGVGFASTWPAYGLSGTFQLNEAMTAEAIVGAFGTISNFGGRLWYRFNLNPSYDLYGFGGVGLLRYGYREFVSFSETRRATENVLGLSGGIGLETGLQALFGDQNLPPLFFNWEVGLSYADFEHYNFSSFMLGGGVRYRFGQW
jgi:hypothetical protein